ncbi:MAG: UTP--glucose-1-phosphate uridylyltransferase GalU, partial [Coriobacteriia bacterium]|nr:UTP--glucose-1-phosphate uridylyltransferase GalU [Coriobacteriia bacterium]
IPAAGLGTRFLPVTKAQPKEMLPVVDKPIMQYVVEEAAAADSDAILLVTGRNKKIIEDHFDYSVELEELLRSGGKTEQLQDVKNISNIAKLFYVRQKYPKGLGHAIACGEPFVGDEPFYVLLGDVIVPRMDVLSALKEAHAKYSASVIAVERVAPELVSRYGVISGKEIEPGVFKIDKLVEKPAPGTEPSNLAVLGRYLLTPKVMDVLQDTTPGAGGEIQLTDALAQLLDSEDLYAVEVPAGSSFDTGNMMAWLHANCAMALDSSRYGAEARDMLTALLDES